MNEDEGGDGYSAIDHLYELMEGLESEAEKVRNVSSYIRTIDIHQFPALFDAVTFLLEQGYGNRLGLPNMDLMKFERWKGEVDTAVLVKLATRVRGLLKEAEGELRHLMSAGHAEPPAIKTPLPPDREISITAVAWVPIPHDRAAELITELAELLEEAVRLARSTNLPSARAALTDLQRAQLVAMLETALAVLKAPLGEKGLFKKLAAAASAGAASAAQTQAEAALGFSLKKIGELILRLLGFM